MLQNWGADSDKRAEALRRQRLEYAESIEEQKAQLKNQRRCAKLGLVYEAPAAHQPQQQTGSVQYGRRKTEVTEPVHPMSGPPAPQQQLMQPPAPAAPQQQPAQQPAAAQQARQFKYLQSPPSQQQQQYAPQQQYEKPLQQQQQYVQQQQQYSP